MPCRPFRWIAGSGDVVTGLVCGPAPRKKPCSVCGQPGGQLCDFPLGDGKTCDKVLCGRCCVPIAKNREYCPDHPRP